MQTPLLDVAVVGAGPAGLTMARRLADTGVHYEIFERSHDVGGIWDIDAPGSPMYETAHFISSKTLSGFPGFPMPDHFPDYPSHRQLLSYIRSFADAFDLRKNITFNTSVVRASIDAGVWTLELDDGTTRQAKYLVCANGVTWVRNEVEWPGEFNGEVRHSGSYRSPSEFAGKRVLVVGAGNSGVDIACDASFAAEQAFLSVRRGYHFIPKHIMGKPSDVFASEGPHVPFRASQKIFGGMLRMINGDLRRFGLPKPDHGLFESHPIMNTQILHYLSHGDCIAKGDVKELDGDDVVFADGSREQVDLVIAATGYKHASPYLDEGTLESRNGRPDLYLGMFARNHPNLAVLGFIEFASAAYENFDKMAEIIVADATAQPGSSTAQELARRKRNHRPDLQGGHGYIDSERHANYVDVDVYVKELKGVRAPSAWRRWADEVSGPTHDRRVSDGRTRPVTKPLALITGAASGIGAEVAQRFVARGYDILVVERTLELAESGAEALGDSGIAVHCDLSDRAQVANLCDRVAGEWADRLELVIANAGIGIPGDVADISTELLQNHVEINLVSVMTLAQSAVQTFLPRRRGHILATVSLGGIAPMPGTAAYAASKAGLRAFLASLNAELHKTGVSVGGIYPSAVDTPMLRYEATHDGSMLNFLSPVLSVDDIADAYEKTFDKKRLETYVPYSEGVQARIALWRPAFLPRLMPLMNRLGERGHKKYLETFDHEG